MKSTVSNPKEKLNSIVRIAPVCNGKIYVVPRPSEDGNIRMDLPIEEAVEQISTSSNRIACKIKEKYSQHICKSASPRFSVRYRSAPHHGSTVYLYILPVREENEVHFLNGKFIDCQEITMEPQKYSSNLHEEGELLGMAAELWADYLSGK